MSTDTTNTTNTDLRSLIAYQLTHGLAVGTVEERAAMLAARAGLVDEAMSDDLIAERLMVAVARADDPTARGDGLWRFTRNGSSRAVRSCRICWAETSWCNRWPRPVRSYAEEAEDLRGHIEELRSQLAAD